MNRSDEIKDLAAALALAQGEMKNPVFDSVNPHFKNKFASLAAVRDVVIPPLSRHNIVLTQLLGNDQDGNLFCETVLIHKTGQWIGNILTIKGKLDAQGIGSAAAYAKRYSMMAILCVVGDDDDDGNMASQQTKETPTSKILANSLPVKTYTDYVVMVDKLESKSEIKAWIEKKRPEIRENLSSTEAGKLKTYCNQVMDILPNLKKTNLNFLLAELSKIKTKDLLIKFEKAFDPQISGFDEKDKAVYSAASADQMTTIMNSNSKLKMEI